jgi:hypothetical protein
VDCPVRTELGNAQGATNPGLSAGGKLPKSAEQEAIETAGYNLRNALSKELLEQATLAPIPPSACKTDPNYDDRMTEVLRALTRGTPHPDIRELIVNRESMTPAHLSGEYRPSVTEILANWAVDEALTEPPPKVIVLFDNILTAGSHFRAAKPRILRIHSPTIRCLWVIFLSEIPWKLPRHQWDKSIGTRRPRAFERMTHLRQIHVPRCIG